MKNIRTTIREMRKMIGININPMLSVNW